MVIALVSDIHGNIEALEAVIADIGDRECDAIWCLGDIIGYGPNPRECLKIAVNFFDWSLIGNHEEAIMFIPEDFNQYAKQAVQWTRDTLNSSAFPKDENRKLWDYLDTLRETHQERDGRWLFVHGSPRQPIREYVMPKDALDSRKMTDIFRMVSKTCFAGHTHVPGAFTQQGTFLHPTQIKHEFNLASEGKVFINIGSIGQPRDQDNRACYCTIDGDLLRWHRVKYDYISTMKKIKECPGLASFLADRLAQGK